LAGFDSIEPGRVWVQENLAGLGSREPDRVGFKGTWQD